MAEQEGCLLAVFRLLQCWHCGGGKLHCPWGQLNMGMGERILVCEAGQMETDKAISGEAAARVCAGRHLRRAWSWHEIC